jgi:hypothetical protein
VSDVTAATGRSRVNVSVQGKTILFFLWVREIRHFIVSESLCDVLALFCVILFYIAATAGAAVLILLSDRKVLFTQKINLLSTDICR